MNESVRLGTFRGIAIGFNWSLLVVVWLLSWSLATVTLPEFAPGSSPTGYWVAAVITAIAFLGGILLHELGHSVVAQREGVGVESITLWLFGGVARLSDQPATPGAEFRIAAGGPAVSLAIAILSGAGALALSLTGADLVVAALGWYATVNLTLFAFNLIPAAPLDGGRLLTAFLWSRSGNADSARISASKVGVVFGQILIGLGLLLFAVGGSLGGLWFVFLGWFLISAARAEQSDVVARGALGGVTVAEVMTPHPEVAPADLPLGRFVDEVAARSHHSSFPLVDGEGAVVGLVTLRRLRQVPAEEWSTRRVRDVAVPLAEVPCLDPGEALVNVLGRLDGADGRALVFSGGSLVGIVSPTDLTRALDRGLLVHRLA